MKTYDFNGLQVRIRKERYANNETLAVFLDDTYDNSALACITVNLNSATQTDKTAFVDENNVPGIGAWLKKNGIAQPAGYRMQSGYCNYELYYFYLDNA